MPLPDAADADKTDTCGEFLNDNSLGSGPYILDKWERNAEIRLRANENYWKGKPNFSEIILKLIPLPQARRAMMATFDKVDQASETVAAIIANLHDVVIILGFFAFFQWEFSLSVLAAVLAVLGYSVNESVVIFDRIREAFRKYRKMSTPEVIDHAITSTMSRTIITHASTEAMVLSMFFFGGPTLHYFSLALTIGILFGIYSSVLVASPIALWLGISHENLAPVEKEGAELDDHPML